MACLVPEKRAELTTEGGLDVAGRQDSLTAAVAELHEAGIVVSLFIDADRRQIEAAREVGAEYVEIHTGRYCDAATPRTADTEFSRIIEGIDCAAAAGLQVNVGHGLNYHNVRRLAPVRHIEEFSIGHSIIARAVLVGMERAVREMVALIKGTL
jgi:pyridoxine 5-phosphate synthase